MRTLLFVSLFTAACFGALYAPIWGVLGYTADYCVGPTRKWWELPVQPFGIRYSLTLALFTAAGIAINWRRLRFGGSALCTQEKLVLLFLGIAAVSNVFGEETWGHYVSSGHDLPLLKHAKITIYLFMLTHVVTEWKNLNRLIWVMILCTLAVGHEAWTLPPGGRLEGIGGPDFSDANVLATFMCMMLWIIGAQFLRSGWKGKIICFLAGGFTANAVIQTQSRGAVIGLAAGGLAALVTAPKRFRLHIAIALILTAAGFYYVSTPQFRHRASTIVAEEEERDSSAGKRIELWKGAIQMWLDHPFGVGIGNFYQTIPRYMFTGGGRPDVHNTFLRCLTELGIQGFLVLALLIFGVFRGVKEFARRTAELPSPIREESAFLAWGLTAAFVTILSCGMFISATYAEFFWWVLVLPVCLRRVADNLEEDLEMDEMDTYDELDEEVDEQIMEAVDV